MGVIVPVQRPHGRAEIEAHYGDPKLRLVQGVYVVDQAWEAHNLVFFYHPVLPHHPDVAAGRVYLHRLVVEPFARLCDRWAARQAVGDPYRIIHIGFFNPRLKRGLDDPSTHTWAIAFDLNPDQNPLVICGRDDPRRLQPFDGNIGHDIPGPWFDDMIAEQWTLGRDFRNRFDPQHAQLCDGY